MCPSDTMPLSTFITRMEAIAKLNRDEFTYTITITPVKHGGLIYDLQVSEEAEGHLFVNGIASTLEGAVSQAMNDLDDAADQWGYKIPKS